MKLKLSKLFARSGKVDEFDTRQIKKALNRLGYYMPLKTTGITGTPDAAVFEALKQFQTDHNLLATGSARSDDETVKKLSSEAGKKKDGQYIWRSVGDDKVRNSHAEMNGMVRDFLDSPDPGEEMNCRCWVERPLEYQQSGDEVNNLAKHHFHAAFFEIALHHFTTGAVILR